MTETFHLHVKAFVFFTMVEMYFCISLWPMPFQPQLEILPFYYFSNTHRPKDFLDGSSQNRNLFTGLYLSSLTVLNTPTITLFTLLNVCMHSPCCLISMQRIPTHTVAHTNSQDCAALYCPVRIKHDSSVKRFL